MARFALFSAWSGQTIFERWTIGMFNVLFTAWPPVILGLFDRPVNASRLLALPSLYYSLHRRAFVLTVFFFLWRNFLQKFFLWIGLAILHSILLFIFCRAFLIDGIVWSNGREAGWLMLGNTAYTVSMTQLQLFLRWWLQRSAPRLCSNVIRGPGL